MLGIDSRAGSRFSDSGGRWVRRDSQFTRRSTTTSRPSSSRDLPSLNDRAAHQAGHRQRADHDGQQHRDRAGRLSAAAFALAAASRHGGSGGGGGAPELTAAGPAALVAELCGAADAADVRGDQASAWRQTDALIAGVRAIARWLISRGSSGAAACPLRAAALVSGSTGLRRGQFGARVGDRSLRCRLVRGAAAAAGLAGSAGSSAACARDLFLRRRRGTSSCAWWRGRRDNTSGRLGRRALRPAKGMLSAASAGVRAMP